ncbi:hypothetical protein [Actomonas aquatica]|uniref:Uncharacterized protein n=1 Tax=Actomonas aquatica TaxID=2866162 RepID=A0ABZ1C355_9BACT|nr:hypothetical protein [Opitutus sp. WL0086]WRQ85643.1 hypothetical protein K1X11_012595 [Opitutus sp. WL0086]
MNSTFRFLSTGFLFAALLLGFTARADANEALAPAENELPLHLAPFVVTGNDLTVTIHARSKSDRRYAEKFADAVMRVADDTLEDGYSPGRGLIILGDEGEPHPLWVFRKFLAMAEAGQLQPAVAERAPELQAYLTEWEEKLELDEADSELGLEFDLVVPALPFQLEGIGTAIYQVAWIHEFDVEQVEYAFHDLTVADLTQDRLSRFNWVYFLPPRNAFDQVIKVILPKVMEQEDMGFFTRTAVRGAMVVFKPLIRKAIEGLRKGMLFNTILQTRSPWSEDDNYALTEAYVSAIMPDMKFNDSRDATHARAMEAIDEQKRKNAEYAKDPFITPERLTDYDPADYAAFLGDYTDKDAEEPTHHFLQVDGTYQWNYRDEDPRLFYPAGPRLLVREDGKMTIEFLVDATTGELTGIEERWHRRRKTVPAGPEA